MAAPTYRPWLHRWALLTAVAVFPLLLSGGTVTSMRVGMADPGWPSPPWYLLVVSWAETAAVNGIGFLVEHGHRQIGWIVGVLTIVLAVWTWFAESRRWVRLLGIAALVTLIVYKPMYHVTASFAFDPVQKVSFSAPFEGMLRKVHHVPGDKVEAGDVLLEFDTTDLELKKLEAESNANRSRQEAIKFRADPEKRAEQLMAEADQRANEALAKFYQSQIDKAVMKAPFAGEVLSGDLREKVLATFKLGDPLMEMAERKDLKAKIIVAERDIQDVKVGAKGKLATSSLPNDKKPILVERIVPLPKAQEGGNFFEVYATLLETDPNWRPGMAGEAKIEVGNRRLGWIWVHRFTEWVELKWWQLW